MSEKIDLGVSDGTRMAAYVASPAGRVASHGLLLFQEAFGVNHHIRALADRFAAAGYLTIAPELYHRTAAGFEADYNDFNAALPHYKALTRAGFEADSRAAFDWLRETGNIAAEHIVASGYCLGGRAAVVAALTVPLAAAASYYGGDLPSLKAGFGSVHAPLLLIWGDKDAHIPVPIRAETTDALRAAQKSFVEVTFSEAGHGFNCDERSAYHAPSAHIAHATTLAFFSEHAGPPAKN